jgi:hypothetical protein
MTTFIPEIIWKKQILIFIVDRKPGRSLREGNFLVRVCFKKVGAPTSTSLIHTFRVEVNNLHWREFSNPVQPYHSHRAVRASVFLTFLINTAATMRSRKEKIDDRTIAVGEALSRTSKLPAFLQFPLLVLLSLTLSSLLYSFIAEYTAGDLASVSRNLDQYWEGGVLVGWRA